MARRGRKLKTGIRNAEGRLMKAKTPSKTVIQRLNDMVDEQRHRVKEVAESQPHRVPFAAVVKGDDEKAKLCESALGRFCLVQRLRKEIYDAACDYADTRRRWRAAIEAPTDLRLHEGGVTGVGPSKETIARWRKELDLAEAAIKFAHGVEGFALIERLVVDGVDLRPSQVLLAQKALETLAEHLLRITKRVSAFA